MPPKKNHTEVSKDNDIKIPKDSFTNKKPYLKPILILYGLLTNLTGSGTGSKIENGPHLERHPRA